MITVDITIPAIGRVIAGPLHRLAGHRFTADPDRRDPVTACGLRLPATKATEYTQAGVQDIGPQCGDCFPD